MLNMKPLFLLACLTPSLIAAAPADPSAVVTAFYRADLSKGNVDPYLAADTRKLLDEANKANKSGKLVLDYDPFCGCQVGIYGATASPAKISGSVATVPVRVMAGLSKKRAEPITMKVLLHRIDGRWQIWDFVSVDHGKDHSFRTQTEKALAYAHKQHR